LLVLSPDEIGMRESPVRRRYISKVANSHSRFADMFIVGGKS